MIFLVIIRSSESAIRVWLNRLRSLHTWISVSQFKVQQFCSLYEKFSIRMLANAINTSSFSNVLRISRRTTMLASMKFSNFLLLTNFRFVVFLLIIFFVICLFYWMSFDLAIFSIINASIFEFDFHSNDLFLISM